VSFTTTCIGGGGRTCYWGGVRLIARLLELCARSCGDLGVLRGWLGRGCLDRNAHTHSTARASKTELHIGMLDLYLRLRGHIYREHVSLTFPVEQAIAVCLPAVVQ